MTEKIKVALLDDHAVLRSGLKMLINSQPDMEVVAEFGDLKPALEELPGVQPEIILLDLVMPGGAGVGAITSIKYVLPEVKIVVLTMHDDPAFLRSAFALGANGYVVKSSADTELISAIRSVTTGEKFVDQAMRAVADEPIRISNKAGASQPIATLSTREREVFEMIAVGMTNQAVADKLSLSVKTVESYRARVFQKLGITSRADLLRLAVESGILKPGGVS